MPGPGPVRTGRISGVRVASSVPLPELPPAGGRAEIVVRRLRGDPSKGVSGRWRTLRRTEDGRPWLTTALVVRGRLFRFAGLAVFELSTSGRRVGAHPLGGLEPEMLRRLLIDHMIPRALATRGDLVLHASAVATPRGAVVFAGPGGAGKSTLAARMALRGHPVMADDTVRLEDRAGRTWVHPTHALLRIRDPVLPLLGEAAALTRPLEGEPGRRVLDARSSPLRFASKAVPLRRLFLLDAPDPALDATEPAKGCPRPGRNGRRGRRDALVAVLDCAFRADPWDIEAFRRLVDRVALSPLLDRVRWISPSDNRHETRPPDR